LANSNIVQKIPLHVLYSKLVNYSHYS